jgi:diamine N-acetyltransferase
MNISLRLVTDDNFDAVVKLSDTLTEDQKRCVAPNMASLAQAYVNYDKAWPRAIYLDEEPVGFVMLALFDKETPQEDQPSHYLWRYMIRRDRQGQGIGKAVLDLLVAKCKEDNIRTLYTSCVMEKDEPYRFYIHYGFLDTGVEDEGERALKLTI